MPSTPSTDRRRSLPALGRLLATPDVLLLIRLYGRTAVVEALRHELDRCRSGEGDPPATVARAAESLRVRLGTPTRRVLNATGVLLHTNLGRAPLAAEVAATIARLATGACDLEIDLETGRRGDRLARVAALLETITGGERAIVANNAAAGLVLTVAALVAGREVTAGRDVLVSRGELVEIGGSFRLPEILAAAGARLVEVGTTNRTRASDYTQAITPATALILRVHPSNFVMRGYTAAPRIDELVAVCRSADVPLVVDEGAGLLEPSPHPELADHQSCRELLAAGVDLVVASGDKLLGAPQSGLMVGRRDLVDRCRAHPLYRALRPGRLVLVGLEAVLRERLRGAAQPVDRLHPDPDAHQHRLDSVAARLGARQVAGCAELGGGAGAERRRSSVALAIPGSDSLALRLRQGEPAVVGYLQGGLLHLDLLTVEPADDDELVAAVLTAVTAAQGDG